MKSSSSFYLFDDIIMIVNLKIEIPYAEIEEFCMENHIRSLAFFGSVLRDDFNPDSDIDILVEFEDDFTPGLDFFRIEIELSEIIGYKVDLNTVGFLSPYMLDDVIKSSRMIYDAA